MRRVVGGGLRRAAGPEQIVVADGAVALGGSPVATANRLKLFGASRLVGSGVAKLRGCGPVMVASDMPMLASEKLPVMSVTTTAFGYFASVAGP